jgi:cyclopropane fatty-acyl-phospholipid synthase-like methyltransferase
VFGAYSIRSVDELSSLRHSREGEKTKEPEFGIYHHSTSAASEKARAVAKAMFTDAFASLPFGRDDELRILDVGCGLAFLSCVSAEFYRNARITGIDTFKHASLKRSSLDKAKENARILGFLDRIDFKKGDVFRFTPAEKFDIIVSNLVFHNFGKKRFDAYSRLSSWAEDGSFVVIGEWFFSPKTDIAYLSKTFRLLREIKPKSGFGRYALLVMSKDSGQVSRD